MERGRNNQLYSFVESLSEKLGDDSKVSLLVGYTVARSLISFNPLEYGRNPRSFKEVWAVYDGLSKTVDDVDSGKVDNIVLELKEAVTKTITGGISNGSEINHESDLLKCLVISAKSRNIPLEQFLKETGTRISRETRSNGLLESAMNRIFKEDYKILERSLSR